MSQGSGIYIANTTFATTYDGATHIIQRGVTRVRAGHEILKNNPSCFDSVDLEVHYDTEDASAEPGVKRGQPTIIAHEAGPSSEALEREAAAEEETTEPSPPAKKATTTSTPAKKAAAARPAAKK